MKSIKIEFTLIYYPCRLRESMQRLTLVRAQMSAVLLLFSGCFLRGALSLILSTTLAGWVSWVLAVFMIQKQTTFQFMLTHVIYVQTIGPTLTRQ